MLLWKGCVLGWRGGCSLWSSKSHPEPDREPVEGCGNAALSSSLTLLTSVLCRDLSNPPPQILFWHRSLKCSICSAWHHVLLLLVEAFIVRLACFSFWFHSKLVLHTITAAISGFFFFFFDILRICFPSLTSLYPVGKKQNLTQIHFLSLFIFCWRFGACFV